MDHMFRMHVADALEQLPKYVPRLGFAEALFVDNLVEQLATPHALHDQKKTGLCPMEAEEVHDPRVVQLLQDVHLALQSREVAREVPEEPEALQVHDLHRQLLAADQPPAGEDPRGSTAAQLLAHLVAVRSRSEAAALPHLPRPSRCGCQRKRATAAAAFALIRRLPLAATTAGAATLWQLLLDLRVQRSSAAHCCSGRSKDRGFHHGHRGGGGRGGG
mmetsp:Transcript_84681/g.215623  ORF Transcript_84681/g.215623 Transcript_84681/m.215623 type:complete len:218 (-) Transcript_84681:17-670(-)